MCKRNWLIFMLILLIGVLVACDSDGSNETEGKSGSDGDKEITIGFSQPTLESPFYIALADAAKEKAEELGVEIQVVDAQNDIEKQNSDIQTLITNQVDVLLLNPTNPSGVTPSIKAAENADIPIITVDRDVEDDVESYVGRDNEEMGKIAAEEAVELLDGKGKIIEIQGDAGGTVTLARHKGFHEVMDKESEIEVIKGPNSDYIRAEAVSAMQDLLQAHPDVELVYAHNDDMALGAMQVLEKANKLDDVKVVGIDGLMESIKGIDSGKYDATVLNDPKKLGYLAVEAAVELANNENIEAYIDGGTEAVTSDNVSDFLNDDLDFAEID